jgi:hypothetical protein
MCECCDDVIKRSVKRSTEQMNLKGKALGIPVVAVALKPQVPRNSGAAVDEGARTPIEEAAAA